MSTKKRKQSLTEREIEGFEAAQKRASTQAELIAAVVGSADDADSDGIPSGELIDVSTGITAAIKESPELLALFAKIEHVRTETVDAKKASANQLMAAIKSPPIEQMSALEKTIRRLKWIIVAVAVPAVSAMLMAGHYIYAKAVSDTRSAVEMEQLIQRVTNSEKKLDELRSKIEAVGDIAKRNSDRIEDRLDRDDRPSRHDRPARGPLDPP